MKNPLIELRTQGQSIWLDNIRRNLMTSGGLKKLIDEDQLRGMTSNPTIFEKAIGGSTDYDAQLRELVSAGKSTSEILDELTIKDIEMAADVFRPVYDESGGEDGFISIEVSPLLAHKLSETVEAAKRLHRRINRPNIMIKVPATPEGIQAFETLTAKGISVNMTLIFSIETYEAVACAYIAGLKQLQKKGQSLGNVRSVASLFVSRVDTVADQMITEKMAEELDSKEREQLNGLLGKVAIANAKMIYEKFKTISQGEEFKMLQREGAHPQRPLWASTGTKNPAYSDVRYLEKLIGPDTVNTVPPATMDAFRDHGKVQASVEENLLGAEATLKQLHALDINLKEITAKLQVAGVESFSASFQGLIKTISAKRQSILSEGSPRFSTVLGSYATDVEKTLQSLDQINLPIRIWDKDPTLWKSELAIQEKIKNRLGWLSIHAEMLKEIQSITEFAASVKASGVRHLVLLGMGGSSLCPEVLRKAFGSAPGYPELIVLDTTDPATILEAERRIDLKHSLFIVASKSGSTIEMKSLYRYFAEKIRTIQGDAIGNHFIAITDPGSALEALAGQEKFRKCFLTPRDIGGRYSALTYFGLVPAALIGIDLNLFMKRAEEVIQASASAHSAKEDPSAHLGVILASLGKAGRDKVTFIASESIASFGIWAEQLVAESTGKEGFGLVPIDGEAVGLPDVYGADRLFVYLRDSTSNNERLDQQVSALRNAGHPVLQIRLRDRLDLAGEFFRWEMATAIAGVVLGINPFDEPNVSESKANTAKVLAHYEKIGRLELPDPVIEYSGIGLIGDLKTGDEETLREALSGFLKQAGPNDYVALMAYLSPSENHETLLRQFRQKIRDQYHLATTLGYGPRFLHSTGQLHKGGAGNGLFIQITISDKEGILIPNAAYSFGVLKRSQALGDFHALTGKGLRVLEIRLGKNSEADLEKAVDVL